MPRCGLARTWGRSSYDMKGSDHLLIDAVKLRANLEETVARLAADQEAGMVRPRVSTKLISNVSAESRFVQYDKDFEFRCDEAIERAGEGSAPSPLRYFLSGLAFCQQVWYAKASALTGVELVDLRIDVSTFMDMRGEHRMGDVPAHPQWIVIDADIDSTAEPSRVLVMVDEANSRCPVYSLVARAVPVYERIRLRGELLRDTVPEGMEA